MSGSRTEVGHLAGEKGVVGTPGVKVAMVSGARLGPRKARRPSIVN